MEIFLKFIPFFILFCFSLEIIPNWNLNTSAIKLLSSDGSITYTVVDRDMYGMKVKLTKKITKSGNTITQTNYLSIGEGAAFEVDFENIESFYNLNGINVICPKGKYHPYNATNKAFFQPSGFEEKGNWDLKCYKHNTNYFLAFYLMNGDKNLFFSAFSSTAQDFSWKTGSFFTTEIFDFKLENGEQNYEGDNWKKYKMGAIILESNYLKLKSYMAEFHPHDQNDDKVYIFDSSTANPLSINLTSAKKYSQAFFKNDSDEFYFFTYNNVSDFISGYSSVTTNDYSNIGNVRSEINQESPFEFVDEAKIIEMNFLLYNKYIYYAINNTKTGEIYHGLYDVKLGKIMFNTNEDISTFIPYSPNSMLAITKDNVYKICALNDGENCIEDCSSGQVIRDSEGNKCGTSCDNNKYLLIPDNVCLYECDTSIYIQDSNKQCGLCKDINSSKPYKLIGSEECLQDIPNTAKVYNSQYNLLICKNGYQLDGNNCVPHCYITCQTCSDYSENENDQKCLTCNESYYLENEKCIEIIPTTNPIIPTTIPIIPTTIITTIPVTEPIFECKEEKCKKCNEESNRLGLCLSCNDDYIKVNYTSVFEQFLDCMKKDDPKLKSFYYNETSKEFRPCFKNCERCLIAGDEESNNCLECKKGFMFRPGNNPKNNCVVYSDYYYITPYDQYKALDVLQCPEESKFRIKDKNSCIDDCKKDKEYKYLYNGNCLKKCPDGMDEQNFLCIENKDECKLVENEIHLKQNEDFLFVNTLAKTYLSEFNYTNNHISLYSNKDYDIIFYKNKRCIDEVSLSMPRIDFKDCYNKVKAEYGIREDLLISIVDQKGTKGAKPFFRFYHPFSGKELEYLSICRNEQITIKENVSAILNDKDNTNYELQMSLIEQGIDIFDLDGPFYKDLCFDFENTGKRDIPLTMRIEKTFPNVKICEQGCRPNGIQLPEKVAICDCSIKEIANKDFIKDNALLDESIGKALDVINSSNIMVMKCYKYIFKYFTRSIGGFFCLTLIIINIISVILYFMFGLPKLKLYILSLTENYLSFLKSTTNTIIENAPPKRRSIKNNMIERVTEKTSKKENIAPFAILNEEKNKNKKSKRLNTGTDTIQKQKERIPVGKPLLTSTKINLKSKNDIIISLKQNKTNKSEIILLDESKEKNKNESKNMSKITDEDKNKIFFEEYLATYPDDMEFDDAIVKDKRKFSECLIGNLKEKQMIVFTFFVDDPIKIRSMKIILFILNINLYFVIPGLFYSEEFISEIYLINEEDEHFFSYLERSIDKLIYTTLVNIIIGYIIDLFFVEEKKIKGIFRREKDSIKNLRYKIIELTKKIANMYLAFIIFVFVILLFSFYYLLCFNYVYPKTQIEWIKCSVTIFIIMQTLSTLNCLLITCLRYLSFKLNSPKIYKFSNILD